MVACALIPRFSLLAALSGSRELLGRPVALASELGGPQVVGECSGAAEAFGIHAGMRLAEALARCPALVLVQPDPARAEATWERALRCLEGIGAAVEPARAGEAFFDAGALRPLWGEVERVLARARSALGEANANDNVSDDAGEGGLGPRARLGAGPSRLCAYAAALRMRRRSARRGGSASGRFVVVPSGAGRAFLAPLPIGILRDRLPDRWERASLPDTLERLGVRTLGELAALPDAAVADRLGRPGLRALGMARGVEEPLRPRDPGEDLAEGLELPEAASGPQLERALELLIARLLAHPARRGRSFRRLRLEARLAAGGGWLAEATLRSASADAERLRLALASKLAELPGPAAALGLRALELGSEARQQPPLARSAGERRRERLGEAVRQARAAAGRDAVLQVLEVDPGSRLPERRAMLTPFPEGHDG